MVGTNDAFLEADPVRRRCVPADNPSRLLCAIDDAGPALEPSHVVEMSVREEPGCGTARSILERWKVVDAETMTKLGSCRVN
jgi:hypothetical protein